MNAGIKRRLVGTIAVGAVATLSLASCSSGSDASKSGGSGKGSTYTVWDPYPQYDASSAWGKLVAKCGTDNGVQVKRTGYDTTKLVSQVLLAAQ